MSLSPPPPIGSAVWAAGPGLASSSSYVCCYWIEREEGGAKTEEQDHPTTHKPRLHLALIDQYRKGTGTDGTFNLSHVWADLACWGHNTPPHPLHPFNLRLLLQGCRGVCVTTPSYLPQNVCAPVICLVCDLLCVCVCVFCVCVSDESSGGAQGVF